MIGNQNLSEDAAPLTFPAISPVPNNVIGEAKKGAYNNYYIGDVLADISTIIGNGAMAGDEDWLYTSQTTISMAYRISTPTTCRSALLAIPTRYTPGNGNNLSYLFDQNFIRDRINHKCWKFILVSYDVVKPGNSETASLVPGLVTPYKSTAGYQSNILSPVPVPNWNDERTKPRYNQQPPPAVATQNWGMGSFLTELNSLRNTTVNYFTADKHDGIPENRVAYNLLDPEVDEEIAVQLAVHPEYNDIFKYARSWLLLYQMWGSVGYVQEWGQRITTNFPVYLYNDFAGLYNYLSSGNIGRPANENDLILSSVNLATDWTVYVKGPHLPDIYLTEKSAELEDFLSSDNNVSGLQRNDFTCEVEIQRMFSDQTDPIMQLPVVWEQFYSYKYDDMMSTSYRNCITITYGGRNLPDDDIELYQYALSGNLRVLLRFRLKYSDTLFSSWCELDIGCVGSPDLDDFRLMHNWGDVVGVSDGSTVTIVYDETPPGVDDYITPSNPGDIVSGDTDLLQFNGLNMLTTTYTISPTDLKSLGNFLWNDDFFRNIKLLNNSPIENIVKCSIVPLALTGTASEITIGNVDTGIAGYVVDSMPQLTVVNKNIGSGFWGNFLDFAPYTKYTLFLPFCGFYEIDPALIIDKNLKVKYVFDLLNGQCKACIFVNDIYTASYNGSCAVDMPLSSTNNSQIQASYAMSIVEMVAEQSPVPGFNALLSAQYHANRTGTYSSTCGFQETRNVFLIQEIPTCQYPASYGHDKGYPCMLTRTLATLSGFTICDTDIDLSGLGCLEEEKEEIRQLLTNGVYL